MTHSIFLGGGHLLNSKGIVKQTMAWEILTDILLDELDAKIGIIDTLDFVANAGN
jgi:hypothetical protein